MSEGTKKVNGIPENEKFMDKIKRKAKTAANWGKTHWKGLAIGALAVGGGAYMLSRRGGEDNGENRPVSSNLGSGSVYDAIDQTFDSEEPDYGGPEDDTPEDEE